MADASFAITGFLGGEVSQFFQGRFDRPDYKISLNICLNSFPVEIGAWTRRPGTQFAGTTRRGANGRIIKFDFQQSSAYTMEFTDGHLRFRSGANLVTTNDSVAISQVSSATPTEITLASAVTWATGDEAFLSGLGTALPLLQNRRFTLTKIDTTHFTLADAITGQAVNAGITASAAPTIIYSGTAEFVSGTASTAVTGSAAVGSGVVVSLATGSGAGHSISTLTDSAGNSYTKVIQSNTNFDAEIWYNGNIADAIVSGTTTFTATTTGGAKYFIMAAYAVSNTLASDKTNSTSSAGATSIALATGTMTNPNSLIVGLINANTFSTYTEGAGFTSDVNPLTDDIVSSHESVQSTSSVTWAPSWTPSTNFDAVLASFYISNQSVSATVNHVNDISTVYTSGTWSSLRSVQTEIAAFFLHSQVAPYELVVTTPPISSSAFATFSLAQSFFEDGPYLDPIPGSTITPGATSGIISLTLGFQAYSSTTAYTKGAFVTSSSIGYQSLQDANVNNTPASSPTFWKVVGFGAAINNGQGFVASDIGRLVRLFSEPALWSSTATYGSGALVSYNPSNLPGGETYWSSLTAGNHGNVPGTDTTNWELEAIGATTSPALWTWGKVTSLSSTGAISGATGTNIGTLTNSGGLAAAFDGTISKVFNSCASGGSQTGYIGKNYTGAGGQTIAQVVIYPSSDDGFIAGVFDESITINLYGGASAPTNPFTNGTLLGSAVLASARNTAPVTIASNNTATMYNFVWIQIVLNAFDAPTGIAQVTFYNNTNSPGVSVNCEILGPALLYSGVTIQTWRLGLYSGTTGYPNVGTYSDGRLWLSSPSYPNRIDASVANGISGVNNGALAGAVNFAPTDQYGNVTDANAIDYTFNAPDANAIYWMVPTLQGIICGTQAGEWLVNAPTSGGLSPNNISARRVTKIGAANVEPRATEHTYVYVQRYSVKLMEYFADIFSGKFTAPNLADKAQHITRAGIAEIAYVHSATPVIWGRDNNNALFGCTYKRDTLMTSQGPTYYAWHRHALGSGRQVVSLAAGPSIGGNLDALTMVTSQPNASDPQTGVYHVEIMTDTLDELATLAQSWFLDDAIVPSSVTFSITSPTPYGGATLNGLWHLNGETVTVFASGLDCGDYIVSNGSVTVPYGDGISAGTAGGQFVHTFAVTASYVVGFTYNSDAQLVRPQEPLQTGARNGPALGKVRRIKQVSALLNNQGMSNTAGQAAISFGTNFSTLFPALLNGGTTRNPVNVPSNNLGTFSGVWMDTVKDEASYDGMICWRISRPLPGNIPVIEGFINTEDR